MSKRRKTIKKVIGISFERLSSKPKNILKERKQKLMPKTKRNMNRFLLLLIAFKNIKTKKTNMYHGWVSVGSICKKPGIKIIVDKTNKETTLILFKHISWEIMRFKIDS